MRLTNEEVADLQKHNRPNFIKYNESYFDDNVLFISPKEIFINQDNKHYHKRIEEIFSACKEENKWYQLSLLTYPEVYKFLDAGSVNFDCSTFQKIVKYGVLSENVDVLVFLAKLLPFLFDVDLREYAIMSENMETVDWLKKHYPNCLQEKIDYHFNSYVLNHYEEINENNLLLKQGITQPNAQAFVRIKTNTSHLLYYVKNYSCILTNQNIKWLNLI